MTSGRLECASRGQWREFSHPRSWRNSIYLVTEIFAFARRAGAHDRGNLAQVRAPDLRRCSRSERRIITTDGSERSVKGAVIDKLASDLRGELLCCDDPDYDAARKVWNGMVDKRPALIARCAGTADIISCARFVRE
jgi:hypothetical protein